MPKSKGKAGPRKAAVRFSDTTSNTPTTTATPVFSPVNSPDTVDTPLTSDAEGVALDKKDLLPETRITRNRKRVLNTSNNLDTEERAPKRQMITNLAYISIEVKKEMAKVRNRFTLR
jgi:DNA repair protein RAD16